MREKLIELLRDADLGCIKAKCHSCGHYDSPNKTNGLPGCVECRVADHLIQNGVTIQKWIPVTERLPNKMGQYVCRYVFGENTDYPFYQVLWYFANLENPHFQHEGSMGLTVTHWMPLPEQPKEVE